MVAKTCETADVAYSPMRARVVWWSVCIILLAINGVYMMYHVPGPSLPPPPETSPREQVLCGRHAEARFNALAGCHPCPIGSFILPGMLHCRPLLGCGEIARDVVDRVSMGYGGVKLLSRATWNGHSVVYASAIVEPDFLHGADMMELLAGDHVNQIIGRCNDRLEIVTQVHSLWFRSLTHCFSLTPRICTYVRSTIHWGRRRTSMPFSPALRSTTRGSMRSQSA